MRVSKGTHNLLPFARSFFVTRCVVLLIVFPLSLWTPYFHFFLVCPLNRNIHFRWRANEEWLNLMNLPVFKKSFPLLSCKVKTRRDLVSLTFPSHFRNQNPLIICLQCLPSSSTLFIHDLFVSALASMMPMIWEEESSHQIRIPLLFQY